MLLVPVLDQKERVYLNTRGLGLGCGNAIVYCLDCQDPDMVKPGKRSLKVVMSADLNAHCLDGSGRDVMAWPGSSV